MPAAASWPGSARSSRSGLRSACWTAPPPTTVEIVASDSVAAEGGANPATFSVVRSGDTANALSVTYAVSGTATAGDDYPAVSGSVVIPPGHASVALTQLKDVTDWLAAHGKRWSPRAEFGQYDAHEDLRIARLARESLARGEEAWIVANDSRAAIERLARDIAHGSH